MRTFVFGDVHGNADLVLGLLQRAGILDENFSRILTEPDVQVVSIGDLLNCVAEDVTGDVQCLKLLQDGVIDRAIVGNHEYPYFGGIPFGGYFEDAVLKHRYLNQEASGRVVPALLVGDVLVTHAGIAEGLYGHSLASAENYYDALVEIWADDKRNRTFSSIGSSRGGWSREGGVLWSDWHEPKLRTISQVVGHTPQRDGLPKFNLRNDGTFTANIDIGGKHFSRLAGLWLTPGERGVSVATDLVVYQGG